MIISTLLNLFIIPILYVIVRGLIPMRLTATVEHVDEAEAVPQPGD